MPVKSFENIRFSIWTWNTTFLIFFSGHAPTVPCTCEVCECPGKESNVPQSIASAKPSTTYEQGKNIPTTEFKI